MTDEELAREARRIAQELPRTYKEAELMLLALADRVAPPPTRSGYSLLALAERRRDYAAIAVLSFPTNRGKSFEELWEENEPWVRYYLRMLASAPTTSPSDLVAGKLLEYCVMLDIPIITQPAPKRVFDL